jgi:hypothetical protein
MDLIAIYRNIRILGVSEERLAEIGWSKAKLLAKHATTENFEELIEIAKNNSREQLTTIIEQQFITAGDGVAGTKIAKTKLSFSLHGDQAETVLRALEVAKGHGNTQDLNVALEYLCGDWLQTADGVEVSLEDAISHLNAKYNVEVAVKHHGHVHEEVSHVAAE